ncbi:MAG: hypothetical protein ACSHWU_10280, partial [Marinicella sp.]
MAVSSVTNFGATFNFKSWELDSSTGELYLNYESSEYGLFTEQYVFHNFDTKRYLTHKVTIDSAIDCLFWMAGVSYYKTSLAKQIKFQGQQPSPQQAIWLTQTWQAGLAELAFENKLTWLNHIQFDGIDQANDVEPMQLSARSLVAIGGGKDSLVSIETIKAMKEPLNLFMVGQSAFIKSVAAQTEVPLISITRKVDSKLQAVNATGAFNGHVPITAINACVAVVTALIYDFDSVVFSNERSADAGNIETENGLWINHQFSKSLPYEKTWQNVISQHITPGLHCFSLLRPFSELAIVKKFSQLPQYFHHFSSCNRNFHLTGSKNLNHHWCGSCPKCAFVYLCLAPFVSPQILFSIFNKELFSDEQLEPVFASLLGITGTKPFECVGEEQECRLALKLLSQQSEWQNHPQ